MQSKKFFAAAAGALIALSLAACSGGGAGDDNSAAPTGGAVEEGGLIGVAMPTQTSERWIADGKAVKEGLEGLGYTVDLEYANDDIPTLAEMTRHYEESAAAYAKALRDGA